MASACVLLSEERLRCSICTDLFTDPISTPCGHNYCKACITRCWDAADVCRCPLCNRTFHTRPEFSVNALVSEMVQRFRSRKLNEEHGAKAGAEVQEEIQETIQEIMPSSVELGVKGADTVFGALISCVQILQAELEIDAIKQKPSTTKQAERFKDLQQEITRLERRVYEVKKLSRAEDHHHNLLQNFTSVDTSPPAKDRTKADVRLPPHHVWTERTAVTRLKTLVQELRDAELRMIQRYEVDVTLDPDTAYDKLILSEDGKQVSQGTYVWNNLPNNTKRFSYCSVLGRPGFSSGRFYFEVQVRGRTGWTIGVAGESINRNVYRVNGTYWAIWLWNGDDWYWANANLKKVLLPVKVQKVGVFVDYEEGLVSFYDVETRNHLYSFTGCSFTERLYPYFNIKEIYRNTSAPLIISPVNHI